MRKMMIMLLVMAMLIPGSALAYYNPYNGMSTDAPNAVNAVLNQRMATRTGPGTQYSEPGTFFASGDKVKLISYTTDVNGVKWVQAEININGEPMRVYTGLKRFSGVNTDELCLEERMNIVAALDTDMTPEYGPGWQYADYDFTLSKGSRVLVLDAENGYDMCEFYVFGKLYRAWFPDGGLIPM